MRAQKIMLQAGAVSKEPGSEAATKIEGTRSSQPILFSKRLSKIVPCLAPVELCNNVSLLPLLSPNTWQKRFKWGRFYFDL